MNKQGFTLIEMLVVVLIIGILAAVALPQYEKSVSRARAAEAMTTSKTILDAAAIYAAVHRTCPTQLTDLDIRVNATGKDWSFGLDNLGSRNCAVTVTPNKGTTFTARRVYVKNPTGSVANLTAGDMYWDCKTGTCINATGDSGFFFDIGAKPIGEGSNFYQ